MEIKTIKAPMTGRIIEVVVSDGDAISTGDMLLVLESMKMENEIYSEYSGTIAKVHVKELQNVTEDDPLFDVEVS
ncbi:MAG: acetyl-CoA carboxylase biotin carboxyl carrier protein subunit [Chloroflexi bacterium]|nr:acetyl-CoA carboxylase biotin carboxyl carrier protein subunit [Chloroflexota bacterium]